MHRLFLLAVPLGLSLLAGCQDGGASVWSWWGLPEGSGSSPFQAGGLFEAQAFAHKVSVDVGVPRSFVELALVGTDQPTSCEAYSLWLQRLGDLQGYVDDVLATPSAERPANDEWIGYVCQEIDAAARDSFGGDGRYRAMHLLLEITPGDVPDSGLFRPAAPGADGGWGGAELLVSGTHVSRTYERSRHGEDILPSTSSGTWRDQDLDPATRCEVILGGLASEWAEGREDYPDRSSVVLQAATQRYYHAHTDQEVLPTAQGEDLDIGVSAPGWSDAGTSAVTFDVTAFGAVSRVPEGFPYDRLLLSTRNHDVSAEPCPSLGRYASMVWPELAGLPDYRDDR